MFLQRTIGQHFLSLRILALHVVFVRNFSWYPAAPCLFSLVYDITKNLGSEHNGGTFIHTLALVHACNHNIFFSWLVYFVTVCISQSSLGELSYITSKIPNLGRFYVRCFQLKFCHNWFLCLNSHFNFSHNSQFLAYMATNKHGSLHTWPLTNMVPCIHGH